MVSLAQRITIADGCFHNILRHIPETHNREAFGNLIGVKRNSSFMSRYLTENSTL